MKHFINSHDLYTDHVTSCDVQVKRVQVLGGERFLVAHTPHTLLLGDLATCKLSEVRDHCIAMIVAPTESVQLQTVLCLCSVPLSVSVPCSLCLCSMLLCVSVPCSLCLCSMLLCVSVPCRWPGNLGGTRSSTLRMRMLVVLKTPCPVCCILSLLLPAHLSHSLSSSSSSSFSYSSGVHDIQCRGAVSGGVRSKRPLDLCAYRIHESPSHQREDQRETAERRSTMQEAGLPSGPPHCLHQ